MTQATSIAMYRICELSFGKNAGFAGFVGYKSFIAADFKQEEEILKFLSEPADVSKQPRRRTAGSNDFDPPLTVVAEPGVVKYIFIIDDDADSSFDAADPVFAIPIAGRFRGSFIEEIEPIRINGKVVAVSLTLDSRAVRQSPLAEAIKKCGEHNGAMRIPICFNLIDDSYGFPQAVIDDHRFPPHVVHQRSGQDDEERDGDGHHNEHEMHEHEDGSMWSKTFNHGGAHPPISHSSGLAMARHRTHGGAHPPGVASYVVVELP